ADLGPGAEDAEGDDRQGKVDDPDLEILAARSFEAKLVADGRRLRRGVDSFVHSNSPTRNEAPRECATRGAKRPLTHSQPLATSNVNALVAIYQGATKRPEPAVAKSPKPPKYLNFRAILQRSLKPHFLGWPDGFEAVPQPGRLAVGLRPQRCALSRRRSLS